VTTFESQLHAAVLETAPAAVAPLRGPAFVFELVNPACQRLASGQAMLGRALADAWPEAWPAVAPWLRHVLETGERFQREDAPLELAAGPGRPRARTWLCLSLERINGPEGLPDRVLFTAIDRTAAVRDRERARLLAEMARELNRGASLEEVVRPALFLLSDEASYITGAVLAVDGGMAA